MCLYVCLCACQSASVSPSLCVCARVCVCVWERNWASLCAGGWVWMCTCGCVCVCVWLREKGGGRGVGSSRRPQTYTHINGKRGNGEATWNVFLHSKKRAVFYKTVPTLCVRARQIVRLQDWLGEMCPLSEEQHLCRQQVVPSATKGTHTVGRACHSPSDPQTYAPTVWASCVLLVAMWNRILKLDTFPNG